MEAVSWLHGGIPLYNKTIIFQTSMSLELEHSLKVNNVVSSGSLEKEIKGEKVREALLEYDDIDVPDNKPGLNIKPSNVEGTFILHDSGEYFLTGCGDEEAVEDSMEYLGDVFTEIGVITEDEREDITNEIQNVICTGNVTSINTVDLRRLSIHLGLEDVVYNAEDFSSARFSSEKYASTFQIFSSAKVLITGASSVDKTEEEFEHFIEHKLVPFFEITERP